MTTMQQLVVGVFRDHTQAEQAINELLQAGFGHNQIRFAGRGISTGGLIEKIKSLFTGQDISAGGIYDDLVNMGAPPDDARYYQSEFEAGRSIVVVQGTGNMQDAISILARYGGYGANQRFAQSTDYGTASGTQERTAATGTQEHTAATGTQEQTVDGEQHLKLREEELRAHKQTVETGEARLHKDVVVEQKSIDVPVMHEEVYIERRPGSGLPSEQPIGEGEMYRIPVHEERVTTEKRPVEREEISFGKQTVQETQRVTDTVQREEAYIDQTGGVNVRDRDIEQSGDIKQGRDVKQGRDARRSRDVRRGRDTESSPDQTTP